jgi:hypothetical protein
MGRRLEQKYKKMNKSKQKLLELKDKHKGQRCFIIGTGPSLKISDLDKLKDEVTIASNKIYLAFEYTDWRPTYYTINDLVVAENNKEIISALPFHKITGKCVEAVFGNDPAFLYLEGISEKIEEKAYYPIFSKDIVKGIGGGFTVTYLNIQLAYYLGIREVYLIGIDFSFELPNKRLQNEHYGEVIVSEGEVNHFLPNYRHPGETWTVPRLDFQQIAFVKARDEFDKAGRKIFNASRYTELDVFPKVKFDSLF